jgi:acetoin utilization deacetylase AcuC-like enzyme
MHPLLVIDDERFTQHLEQVPHLENARRIRAIRSALNDPTLNGKWSELEPRLASKDELALVHTADHIERVAQTAEKPLFSFDLDTQTTAKSYDVSRLGVGGVFSLLDAIWNGKSNRGFACIRPPGHHAEPGKAMGFCLFNNIALGARYLKERYSVGRIMIVDIDVHHGNGIQSAFYDTDEVLYVSLHQFPCYPGTGNFGEVGRGRGEGFTVNVPLGKGHGDRDLAGIIHYMLNPLALAYHPDMILVSCGFDLYMHDPLGGMMVTPKGYALITFFLLDIAQKVCNGRIAFVMEGGYSLKGVRECGLRVMQELCDVPTLNRREIEKVTGSSARKLSAVRKAIEIQKEYWKILR